MKKETNNIKFKCIYILTRYSPKNMGWDLCILVSTLGENPISDLEILIFMAIDTNFLSVDANFLGDIY